MIASARTLMQRGFIEDAARDERLSSSWQAILEGRAGPEDAELVLSDLAAYSGYYSVAEPGTDPNTLGHYEGRRATFARILFLLDLPGSYMSELRRAALDAMQMEQDNHG